MKLNFFGFACVSLVHLKNSVIFFRFFSLLLLLIFRFASTNLFSLRSEKKGKPFISFKKTKTVHLRLKNISFRFKKHFFRNISLHISLYIINFSGRISKAAMGAGGRQEQEHNVFRVPRSSLRVWSSSVGCSVAQKGAA